jgi:hypothetical protein
MLAREVAENLAMGVTRNWARAACVVLLVAFTAGCDDEGSQREAFIEYLQVRIIDKPGLHVPHPTEAESKSFGPYAQNYQIILDFNDGLSRSVAVPMQTAMQRGAMRSLDDVATRRADFVAVRDGMKQLHDALMKALATADAARAALKQPDDLKTVFDKAYDRTVTVPAKTFDEIFPAMDQAIGNILSMSDFIGQHRAQVKLNGSMIEVSDPALRPQLQTLLDAISKSQEAVARAQQKMNAIANGT